MNRASAWLAMVCCVALWALAARAAAQASGQAEPTSALTAAQKQHQAAVRAFALGDYREAIALFSAADKQLPSAAFSFNIAKAYEALGDASQALSFYRDYLRRAGDPPDATQVTQHIRALDAQLATHGAEHVALSTSPALVERVPASAVTPAAPLTSVSSLAPRTIPMRTPEPAPGSGLRTAGFATLGAGLAALGGGLIFEIMRANTENAAKHENEQTRFAEQLDTMRSQQTVARVFAGAGVALAAVGGVLLTAGILASKRESAEKLALACQPSGCHATFAGVF